MLLSSWNRGCREHLGEDFLGEDVLDQHFPHVGLGERGIDGLPRVLEELAARRARSRGLAACFSAIISRSASSTAGRSALNCFTALRNSAISGRS